MRRNVLLTAAGIVIIILAGHGVPAAQPPPPEVAYIYNVPDWNQPSRSGAINICAPVAALNMLNFYDTWGISLHPGLVDRMDSSFYALYKDSARTADLIGYFMGTNGMGSPARINNPGNPMPGTHYMDQDTGLIEYIAWTRAGQFHPSDPAPPNWKRGYQLQARLFDGLQSSVTADTMWKYYKAEIDAGRPVKIDFNFWNPEYKTDSFIMNSDTFHIYDWGDSTTSSTYPPENWGQHVGHAVTGVGYIPNWNGQNWGIVHDGWETTHVNVVIPWDHLMAMITLSKPGLIPVTIDRRVPMPAWCLNHCIACKWDGLGPPGYMGIWCASHATPLYFPSDTIEIADRPKSYLDPGTHIATLYGPATSDIAENPVVVVPDRYSYPCTLYVQVPEEELIDEATDLNAIRLSGGDAVILPVDDTVETMVFLASCDGDGGASPDQSLTVMMNYDDGTTDTATFENIHPAGRGDIDNPGEILVYDNEVFVCTPAYFDDPTPHYDLYHSEALHWYALYPNNTKYLSDIMFEGTQTRQYSDIYIFAISYSKWAVPETGLAGQWRFEEGGGDIAYDESDHHNDGTIRGADWVYIGNCFSEYALEFHGGGQFFDGDRVAVPHSPSLNITGPVTVCAFIKATGSDSYLAIVDKYNGGTSVESTGFTLFLSAGRLRFTIYSGANGAGDCTGSSDLRDGLPHHVAGVWDGATIRVYVDGQIENEVSWAYPPASTTNDLGIGERICGWGGYMPFLGIIDEVSIYNEALTDMVIDSMGCRCIPGDANNDCTINVGDAVYLINYIFKSGPAPAPYELCSGDANSDCQCNVGDAVFIINYVFKNGPAPVDCVTWKGSCGPLH